MDWRPSLRPLVVAGSHRKMMTLLLCLVTITIVFVSVADAASQKGRSLKGAQGGRSMKGGAGRSLKGGSQGGRSMKAGAGRSLKGASQGGRSMKSANAKVSKGNDWFKVSASAQSSAKINFQGRSMTPTQLLLEVIFLVDRTSEKMVELAPNIVSYLSEQFQKDYPGSRFGLSYFADFQCSDVYKEQMCEAKVANNQRHDDPEGCYTPVTRLATKAEQVQTAIHNFEPILGEIGTSATLAAVMLSVADRNVGWSKRLQPTLFKIVFVLTDAGTNCCDKRFGIKMPPKGDGTDKCATMNNPTPQFVGKRMRERQIGLFLGLAKGGSMVNTFNNWKEMATRTKVPFAIADLENDSNGEILEKFRNYLVTFTKVYKTGVADPKSLVMNVGRVFGNSSCPPYIINLRLLLKIPSIPCCGATQLRCAQKPTTTAKPNYDDYIAPEERTRPPKPTEEPTTEETTTEETTTEEPTTEETTTEETTTEETTTEETTTEETTTEEPTTEEPTTVDYDDEIAPEERTRPPKITTTTKKPCKMGTCKKGCPKEMIVVATVLSVACCGKLPISDKTTCPWKIDGKPGKPWQGHGEPKGESAENSEDASLEQDEETVEMGEASPEEDLPWLKDSEEGDDPPKKSPVEDDVPGQEDPVEKDPPKEDPPQEDPVEKDPPEEDPPQEDPVEKDPPEEDPPREDPVEEDPPEEDPPQEDPVDGDGAAGGDGASDDGAKEADEGKADAGGDGAGADDAADEAVTEGGEVEESVTPEAADDDVTEAPDE